MAKRKKRSYKKRTRPNSLSGRTRRLVNGNPFCPEGLAREFARLPEAVPSEVKRRGGRWRPLRHALTREERDEVIQRQGDTCTYCGFKVGTTFYLEDKEVVSTRAWDHFKPYSKYRDNDKYGVLLACNICNGLKSDNVFKTISEAREHVLRRFIMKGYSLFPHERIIKNTNEQPHTTVANT